MPNTIKDQKELVKDALDSFKVIKDSLSLYYDGKQHMFKPIAGQLRILYCDTHRGKDNSLLNHIYPDLKLVAFQNYEFKKEHEDLKIKILAYDANGNERTAHSLVIKPACYVITQKSSGLQIADLDLSNPPTYLSCRDWCDQIVDSYYNLSVRKIIRIIADRGGGSHVDIEEGHELSQMKETGPAGVGLHVLFIIALARYTMQFAKQFAAEWVNKYPDLLESVKKNSQVGWAAPTRT